jgi:5-methylcytosine-specific restriction endonuclease McrA
MAMLKPVARAALKRKEYKANILSYLSGKIEWSDKSLKPVKDAIRELLRVEQKDICPYCQRIIIPERRNVNEHIEHFLDKSKAKYKMFAFTASNLILACQGCNVEKGTKDLVDKGRAALTRLSRAEAPFLWPHPYFDDMQACIKKSPGPVYSPIVGSGREVQAARLIKDLKLNDLQNIETRHGRLVARRGELLKTLMELALKNDLESQKKMAPLIIEMDMVISELS